MTVGDPKWMPLTITAPDPSYPDTHSTISSAGATVLSAFFGNQDHIRVTSDDLPGTVRIFASHDYLLPRDFAKQFAMLQFCPQRRIVHKAALDS